MEHSFQSPTWFKNTNKRTFPNLTVSNSRESIFSTNASIFAIMCPLYSNDIEELIDTGLEPIVILPDLSEESMTHLDQIIHTGCIEEESIPPINPLIAFRHIIPTEILDEFQTCQQSSSGEIQSEPTNILPAPFEMHRIISTSNDLSDLTKKNSRRICDKEDRTAKKKRFKKIEEDPEWRYNGGLESKSQKSTQNPSPLCCPCGCGSLELCSKASENNMALKETSWRRGICCPICGLRFKQQHVLDHLVAEHPEQAAEFRCPHCTVKIPSTEIRLIRLHLKGHKNRKLECIACGCSLAKSHRKSRSKQVGQYKVILVAKFKQNFNDHLELYGPGHNKYCVYPQCPNIEFSSFKEREEHVKSTHDGVMTYRCGHCMKIFQSRLSLTHHIGEDHRIKRMVEHEGKTDKKKETTPTVACTFCEKMVRKQDIKVHHRQCELSDNFRPYKCTECSVSFGKKFNLDMHILTKHAPEDERPYPCEVCGKRFVTRSDCKRHTLIHENIRRMVKKSPCPFCGKMVGNVENHQRQCELSDSFHPFKCTQCDRSFGQLHRLDVHILSKHVPEEERPYPCEVCGKRFGSKVTRKKHILIHENKRESVCSVCGIGFNDRSNLRQHERRVHSKL